MRQKHFSMLEYTTVLYIRICMYRVQVCIQLSIESMMYTYMHLLAIVSSTTHLKCSFTETLLGDAATKLS